MSVKSGVCVKTGARLLLLEYGRVVPADLFLVGDSIVANLGCPPHDGDWLKPDVGGNYTHTICLGLAGYYHEKKLTMVVPCSHLEGELPIPAIAKLPDDKAALQGLVERMASMLQDLHNNYGWDELGESLEGVLQEATALGCSVESDEAEEEE